MANEPEAAAPSTHSETPVERSQPLSVQEMRTLCGPLLETHQAVGEAVDRERLLTWRLAGALAGLLLGASFLVVVVNGPLPSTALIAWALVLGFLGTLIIAPRSLLAAVRRWNRPEEQTGRADASDSAILYRAVRTVHHSAESAERLWAAVIVLGVLVAPLTGIFSFVLFVDILRVAVPGWLSSEGPVAFPLLLVVAGAAVSLTVVWVVRRVGQLERLRAILATQLAGLERLEVALWMRF